MLKKNTIYAGILAEYRYIKYLCRLFSSCSFARTQTATELPPAHLSEHR